MINIIIAVLQLIFAIGLILFWIIWFKIINKEPGQSEIYLAHERSFPLPDLGLICTTLLISAIGLLMGATFGIFFTILSSGGLFFLGLIDLAFNTREGGYVKSKSDRITSFVIVALVITLATINLVYGWMEFQNLTVFP